jgi:UDP-GlcNAc:undecaprenyl-phosphate/decaprenyl-phosphate GlcNAc-1-phosphate transferase
VLRLPIETRFLMSLVLALAVVYLATPVAIRIATHFDFYDKPVGYKGHGSPTPYLGGAAVMVGFLLALGLTGEWSKTLPVAGGAVALWAIGTLDDRRTVTPTLRVTVELGLAAMLWALGLGWDLGAGPIVDLAVTCLWVVAVVNALNLFDNMDGQAATMAFVIAGTTALLGLLEGQVWLAAAGAALAGACLGFLPHNLASPPRVFLGDGGSMPIGFALAALVMVGASEAAPPWQALAMGVLLVGVPALDTGLVMISRRRRGVSILTAGQDHLSHRTRKRLRTARAVALALGGGQALLATLALVSYQGGSVLLLAVVLAYLVAAGTLIALLDAGQREAPAVAHEPLVSERLQRRPVRPPWEAALLVPSALVMTLSPFAAGYYDSSLWAPAGLVLIVVLVAALIARPPRLARPALLALTGLAALGAWSLASALWAQSVQQAVLDGNRLLVYAVLLALLLVLVRSAREALWLTGALALAACGYVVVEYVRLSVGDGASLFLGGRLDQPLGYINGLAAFHLLALWPAVALAEHRTRPLLAGVGLGLAMLVVTLLVLSQSRGVALAAGLSAIVLLVLVPGRLRRACALLALGVGLAVLVGPANDVFTSGLDGSVDEGLLRELTSRAVLVAAGLAAAWGAATALVARARDVQPLRRAAAVGLTCIVVIAAGAALVDFSRIARTAQRQYDAFVHLSSDQGGETTGSRVVSGAGNRYDYWRIAAGTWKDHALVGVGAGNYDRRYFVERRTGEDIRQPHSLQLQTLSELGLAGAALLVVFLSGVGWGIWRRRCAASRSDAERFLLVAAAGAFTAWLVHTSVDWLHLLPGITAIALAAAAVLLRPETEPDPTKPRRRTLTLASAIAIAAALVMTGVSLSREVLVEHYASNAARSLATDPANALNEANQALRLAPEQIPAYYTKAAALARFGDGGGARAALLEALEQDRGKYVTWALLGDLAVRSGDLEQARANYRQALARNPRDPALEQLVRDPLAALGATG